MALPTVQVPEVAGVEEAREQTRKYIAWVAIIGLFATLITIVVGGWLLNNKSIDETLQMLTTAIGVLAGIVGAIIGYYFRSEQ
jgi:VIT1/CCC1 family predicted Fe2+/Mn2+ transporter